MSEEQSYEEPKSYKVEEEKYEKTDIIQQTVQLLPTGINVKMWSKYGEATIKGEILYVLQ